MYLLVSYQYRTPAKRSKSAGCPRIQPTPFPPKKVDGNVTNGHGERDSLLQRFTHCDRMRVRSKVF